MLDSPGDITILLAELKSGNQSVHAQLAPLVLDSLRKIAGHHMRRERGNHTLQPTALVNEAYLELIKQENDWQSRAHFFAVASRLMRRILIDHARAHNAKKRGGDAVRVDVDLLERGHLAVSEPGNIQLLALDEALFRLSQLDERQARVVEMRFFGGMTDVEIAEVLQLSVRSVLRDWALARSWLHSEMSK